MGERRRDRKQLKATKAQTRAALTLADRQAALHQQQMAEQRRQHAAQLGALQQVPSSPPPKPPPAGRWGTDPSGKWAKRWYDGSRWTEHVEDASGQRHSDPPPSSAG